MFVLGIVPWLANRRRFPPDRFFCEQSWECIPVVLGGTAHSWQSDLQKHSVLNREGIFAFQHFHTGKPLRFHHVEITHR